MNDHDIRTAFHAARAAGLRAKEAAEAVGLSEGGAIAAHLGAHDAPLQAIALRSDWLGLLQSLEACGPLMALTRNETVVHEKTGVYQNVSASGYVGLALGEDIDLRLFFGQWHAGFAVAEALKSQPGMGAPSLQFFDRHGLAVHKIHVREQTDLNAWQQVIERFTEPQATRAFVARAEPVAAVSQPAPDAVAFHTAWAAMTDTHQFFGLLKQFGLERQQSFCLAEGRFTHRLERAAVRALLIEAAFDGTPIMVFVGSPGCIQIHTGPVKRIEPMKMQGKAWLNVLDPGFNLHLREDLIEHVWVVEKPTDDGVVTSVEAFDHRGELMAMFFGARKPGQSELPAWRHIVAQLQQTRVGATA
ncbi:hemin-degrading factor [Hydrogenophaga sp.]|uniref:hemin-degrading factor n=1 Tax=Hydrogenophaga sp. TaxID=1904254 RepID=UPI002716B80D|nr:ChuX/HutX family heme-like substrate-binding protein [Hydrogenophaga sp.]MDO9438985.1 ChuX/HutX family heme-like substrate-binding protein [Hydrogenophaga sp.]